MSDSSSKRCNCYSKGISYKEIKLWATAYLRYIKKPVSNKISEEFERDISDYRNYVRDYFEDFNKNVNATLRVAFARQTLEFSGDPYVKLEIYLEYTDRSRYYETQKGTAAQGEADKPMGPNGEPTGGGESMNPDTNGGKDMQADANMSGPGTVTPPRCPPDAPTMRVSKVTYTDCAY